MTELVWLGPVFMLSLLGSAHCVGMCGGFAAYTCSHGTNAIRSSAAYHTGRLTTYLGLGALAGAASQSIDSVGRLTGIGRASALIVGVCFVIWGVRGVVSGSLGTFLPKSLHQRLSTALSQSVRARLAAHKNLRSWTTRSYLVGALSTLLPCGWLYGFVGMAAGSGSALRGAALMLAFWLGSVPALAALSFTVRSATVPISRKYPRLVASSLVAAGLFAIAIHTSPNMLGMHSGHDHGSAHHMATEHQHHGHHR